jgi:hypothetical protein
MTYLIQSDIAANQSMLTRVAQCAAQEGEDDPDSWAHEYRRQWAAAPGWEDAWASALAAHPPPDPPADGEPAEAPYDPGADEAVITDAMILSQVQSML